MQQKGGEEETGPLRGGRQLAAAMAASGYIWDREPWGVRRIAHRIFIAARGELKLPNPIPRGFTNEWFTWRAGDDTEGRDAQLHPHRRRPGKTRRVVDAVDKLFIVAEGTGGGPHKIKISPYDPQRHASGSVNDSRHVIYKFTNDGKQLMQTLGETDVQGEDEKHFDRKTSRSSLTDPW